MRLGTGAAIAALLGAALCTAGPANASAIPAGARASAATWHKQAVPVPSKAEVAKLLSVSCPASGVCTAVGFSSTKGIRTGGSTLAERWAGGRWAIQSTPQPKSLGLARLNSVSCPTATDCTAVGFRADGDAPLAENWDGTSWAVQTVPLPAGAGNTSFNAVSCASPTSCFAVGIYYAPGSPDGMPLVEYWNGTTWAVQTVPVPTGARDTGLSGVSCPTATDCTAVGSYNSSDFGTLFAEQWNGTAWTVQTMPSGGGLSGVSCASPAACIAIGAVNDGALAEHWNGTAWTTLPTPPDGTSNAVSCASPVACTAVGGTVAEHWNGTKWVSQPLPTQGSTTGFYISGVSCLSATYCTAVGFVHSKDLLAYHE